MTAAPILGVLTGLLPGAAALHHGFDRDAPHRWRNVAFWGAFALTAAIGPMLPDVVDGLLVLLMVWLATIGLKPAPVRSTDEAQRMSLARRFGAGLFLPALAVPVLTLSGALLLPRLRAHGRALFDPGTTTLVALSIALLLALLLALRLTRAPPAACVTEGRRLADAFGWAMVLPQLLAALGGIFALAGVGTVIAGGAVALIPSGSFLMATILFCAGMAVLTILTGNAFTAFPILMGGIGIPILVRQFGGDAAVVAALGMLSGFCGTLLSPMAATFNIVPVALLDLPRRSAVIRVQAPTAIVLLLFNIAVILFCAFPSHPRGAFR